MLRPPYPNILLYLYSMKHKKLGFSLVEIMFSSVLGGLILIGIFQLYIMASYNHNPSKAFSCFNRLNMGQFKRQLEKDYSESYLTYPFNGLLSMNNSRFNEVAIDSPEDGFASIKNPQLLLQKIKASGKHLALIKPESCCIAHSIINIGSNFRIISYIELRCQETSQGLECQLSRYAPHENSLILTSQAKAVSTNITHLESQAPRFVWSEPSKSTQILLPDNIFKAIKNQPWLVFKSKCTEV